MTKLSLALGIVAASIAASLAMAEPGGYGYGPGCGAAASAPGANCPAGAGGQGPGYGRGGGMGPGMGRGPGGGTLLLTPEEQAQHRDMMHSFKTVEECNAYLAEHQKLMAERAKEKGLATPAGPRGKACERMKARGMFG